MEIKIFLDEKGTQEIKDSIEFGKVDAGKITRKSLFIKNIIVFPIDVEISLIGEDIELIKSIKSLMPNSIKELTFELKPKLTTMKPITAKLKININYTVR